MPSPPEIAARTGNGASLSNGAPDIGPEQNPDATQGEAPGGRWTGEELPVVSVDAPPATFNGFRPSDANPPLPAPGSSEGSQEAPRPPRR